MYYTKEETKMIQNALTQIENYINENIIPKMREIYFRVYCNGDHHNVYVNRNGIIAVQVGEHSFRINEMHDYPGMYYCGKWLISNWGNIKDKLNSTIKYQNDIGWLTNFKV